MQDKGILEKITSRNWLKNLLIQKFGTFNKLASYNLFQVIFGFHRFWRNAQKYVGILLAICKETK